MMNVPRSGILFRAISVSLISFRTSRSFLLFFIAQSRQKDATTTYSAFPLAMSWRFVWKKRSRRYRVKENAVEQYI